MRKIAHWDVCVSDLGDTEYVHREGVYAPVMINSRGAGRVEAAYYLTRTHLVHLIDVSVTVNGEGIDGDVVSLGLRLRILGRWIFYRDSKHYLH